MVAGPLRREGAGARPGRAGTERGGEEPKRPAHVVARERLALVIEAGLQRTFDAPFDVHSPEQAARLLRDPPPGWMAPAVLRGIEWALGRGVGSRLATRFGLRAGGGLARKVVIPVTIALEAGISARDGMRELQVMAAYLASRLRGAGHPADHELVRRAVSSLYLEPGRRPELGQPAYQLALGIARRWLTFSMPVPGMRGRRRRAAEARLGAIAHLDVDELAGRWRARPLPPPPPVPPSALPGAPAPPGASA